MTRLRMLVCACLLALSPGAAEAQVQVPPPTSPIVGTWGTTLYPGTYSAIYVTMILTPTQQLQEHLMNRLGVGLDLTGTYQFDAASGQFTYTLTDYSPKAICTPGVGCTGFPVPNLQFGVPQVDLIQFPTPNFMLARTAQGSVTPWTREN